MVLINLGIATDANLGLLAGAIISGAYFGDKISPLSDTTNMAAMGAGVPLYSHVRSMVNTTGPAYVIAVILTLIAGFMQPAHSGVDVSSFTGPVANDLASAFSFNVLVWVPLLVMIIGAAMRKPPLPTLLFSAASGAVVAIVVQGFSFADVITSLINGVKVDMTGVNELGEQATAIIERGGLYSMSSAVLITLCVFMWIGSLDLINAMGVVVERAFGHIKSRPGIILASLVSSAFVNGASSNQYATSFIIGSAFGPKYDEAGIPRKVLSRSIEDYGTFIEPMLPWTTTGVYMVGTLGVAYADYIPFMFLQWANFIIAPLLAITGIGCFYNKARKRARA